MRGDAAAAGRAARSLLLLFLLATFRFTGGAVGGADAGDAEWPAALVCRVAAGLTGAQRAACAREPAAGALALRGVRLALAECRYALRRHRWNCSSLPAAEPSLPHPSPIMQRGFRESAFVHALTAAGAAAAVARGCAAGAAGLACGCAAAAWKWRGCERGVRHALRQSARLLDAREAAGDLRALVNLHNNRAGRLALAGGARERCKCHGVSGSCQMRTCWRTLPPLRAVAATLVRRYRTALLLDRAGLNRAAPELLARRPRRPRARLRRPPPTSLLYYERSPSFCESEPRLDTDGTRGRECSAGGGGADGCGVMCCGRGHALVRRSRLATCRCRFQWCCRVRCEQCRNDSWAAVCK